MTRTHLLLGVGLLLLVVSLLPQPQAQLIRCSPAGDHFVGVYEFQLEQHTRAFPGECPRFIVLE